MRLLFERSWDENHHVCPFCPRKSWKILRVYMVLGDAVSKLETFVWILSHVSRPITWSLLTLKASYLVKWSISTWSFMWWCQFIDWLKFETRPSSLLNFGTAYSVSSFYFTSYSLFYAPQSTVKALPATLCTPHSTLWAL